MSWRTQPRDERGRWTKTGGGVVAVIVALVVGAGGAGTTVGASAGAAGSGTAAGRSVSGGQSAGARVRARDRSTAQVVRRLETRGLRVTERGVDATHVVNVQAEPLGRTARATQLAERLATTAVG